MQYELHGWIICAKKKILCLIIPPWRQCMMVSEELLLNILNILQMHLEITFIWVYVLIFQQDKQFIGGTYEYSERWQWKYFTETNKWFANFGQIVFVAS